MLHINRSLLAIIVLASLTPLGAADSDRDFSGKWVLDQRTGDLRALTADPEPYLAIEQDATIRCTATTAAGASVQWSYNLNGDDSIQKIGAESRNSVVKWEGPALLINTLVSGPQSYTVMDRWELSRNRSVLTIHRQTIRGTSPMEAQMVYRREGMSGPATAPSAPIAAGPAPGTQPVLITRPELRPAPAEYTILAGTHVLLSLTNNVSTKNSKDGDRVYLQTSVPVAADGHIVIPRGSYVQGTVTKTKEAGRGSNKGELYIRFDSLTLPNGVSRDFRARLTSADATKGKVDPTEGKITGDSGKTGNKTARNVGIGTMGGVIVGGAAGHPIMGAGIGALGGLASVLLSKNQDVVLPRGTAVEMVLDRDLYYTAAELRN